MPFTRYMRCCHLQLLLPVCVAALIFVLAEAVLQEVLAKLGFILGFNLIITVLEFAVLSFLALILEEVSTNPLSLNPEEVLDLALAADIDDYAWRLIGGCYGDKC